MKKWHKETVPHPAVPMFAANLVPGILMCIGHILARQLTPSNPYARGLTLVNGRMRHSFFEPLRGKGHDGSRGLTTETGATGPRGIGRGPSTQQHQHSCRLGSLCLLGNGTKVDTWWGSGCPFCRSGLLDRSPAINGRLCPCFIH